MALKTYRFTIPSRYKPNTSGYTDATARQGYYATAIDWWNAQRQCFDDLLEHGELRHGETVKSLELDEAYRGK